MTWNNIRLIFSREVRDQLRDRRTMFTIFVLPLLLYPLMGMSFMQAAQFLREHPARILILGAEHLPSEPALIDGQRFVAEFCDGPDDVRLLELTLQELELGEASGGGLAERLQALIDAGRYEAAIVFPADFRQRLETAGARGSDAPSATEPRAAAEEAELAPRPEIYYNTAKDASRLARERVAGVLWNWRERLVEQTLERAQLPPTTARPFQVESFDVSAESSRRAAVWSKVLPFVVLVWALTGAFYPAIDLCAGEKERGTLETLLCSPAGRNEIVVGKLLTVMVFSMATAMLNLLVMTATATFAVRQLEASTQGAMAIGAPPLLAIVWLTVALAPLSALFSALALAIAAFARSNKEGQYYLMPLLMISLPLMMLPMLPSMELNLGGSIIPITGVMLLLRALIEAQYVEALKYAVPAIGVTAICCYLAVRWAIDQFNNENVMFRESERFRLDLWIRNLTRQREETPTFGAAILCGVLILLARFFASLATPAPDGWREFMATTLISQVALIAGPALLMTLMLTTSARRALLLKMPHPAMIPAAVALAAAVHPLMKLFAALIQLLYPISEEAVAGLAPVLAMFQEMPLPWLLLTFAAAPAICEELAFRGFILSGLRHMGRRRQAILLSSVFFGVAHGLLHQSIAATCVGVLIGYLAVQSGSLLPGVLFHFTHNSLMLLASRAEPAVPSPDAPLVALHELPQLVLGALAAGLILYWVRSLPREFSEEERRQDALEHQNAATPAG